jgi:hypothetical protein
VTAVRILRVLGARATSPGVLAIVGDHRVSWDPRGWDCDCPDPECRHVDVVADLLDPRVTGGAREHGGEKA